MGKIYSQGKVVQGDFEGQYVLYWKGTWGIAPADCFSEPGLVGELLGGTNLTYKVGSYGYDYRGFNWDMCEQIISPETVDHYVELGEAKSGPNADAMAKGTMIGGLGLGLLVGAASASISTADVAIYCKNGKKFVVHFKSAQHWSVLRNSLFKL